MESSFRDSSQGAFLGLICLIMIGACTSPDAAVIPTEDESWVSLFNGETLEGWTPKIRGEAWGEDARSTFRVQDGSITVGYDQYEGFADDFGHLFYESPFSYYRLRLEYRFMDEQVEGGPGWAFRNSGIMVHSPPGESMTVDQDFPISIEVQLLGGNGTDERSTANLCTPGTNVVMDGQLETRHCINSRSATYHGDDWVQAEILVLGDSLITHVVEGEPVLSYHQPQMGGGNVNGHDPEWMQEGALLDGGYISLQSESHPVQFRNVTVLNLSGCTDSDDPAYRPWYVDHNQSSCAEGQ